MKLLEGKKGLIVGVANDRSLAWGIAQSCHTHGADIAFTYLNEALEKRVRPLAESVGSNLILRCDVQKDEEIAAAVAEIEKQWGRLDFVVHSVAYASGDDLKDRFVNTSREGFKLALDVSAYSLVTLTKHCLPLMKEGGSILTLSYLGSIQVVPHYRVMGVAKAALEACVRELAVELGPDRVRVNVISAGPIKTLAASGIADFRALLQHFEGRAPMRKLVTQEEVGDASVFLLSDLSRSITGECMFVDGGFHITAI
ncbi:MAG: enoyl-ACP reductase [Deltaproteobacteria bacterium]|nr:enoyl-ACP reductase [Deltaproteobacteria bacterium]